MYSDDYKKTLGLYKPSGKSPTNLGNPLALIPPVIWWAGGLSAIGLFFIKPVKEAWQGIVGGAGAGSVSLPGTAKGGTIWVPIVVAGLAGWVLYDKFSGKFSQFTLPTNQSELQSRVNDLTAQLQTLERERADDVTYFKAMEKQRGDELKEQEKGLKSDIKTAEKAVRDNRKALQEKAKRQDALKSQARKQ